MDPRAFVPDPLFAGARVHERREAIAGRPGRSWWVPTRSGQPAVSHCAIRVGRREPNVIHDLWEAGGPAESGQVSLRLRWCLASLSVLVGSEQHSSDHLLGGKPLL
jgi:hypothetical protein